MPAASGGGGGSNTGGGTNTGGGENTGGGGDSNVGGGSGNAGGGFSTIDAGPPDAGVCVPNCVRCYDDDGCGGRCTSGRLFSQARGWVDWTCNAGDECVIGGWNDGTCMSACNPARADSCDAGMTCGPVGVSDGKLLDGGKATTCMEVGPRAESELCASSTGYIGCTAGLVCDCLGTGACFSNDNAYCHRLCGPGLPCGAGQTCETTIDGYGAAPWGKCTPPSNPCTPNPCVETGRNQCSLVDGQAACGCNPGTHEANGQCVCTPQCSGKTCGADGCGGSCGTCGGGSACVANGTCAACNPVTQVGCASGQRCRLNGSTPQCTTSIGPGAQGASCNSDSECSTGTLCTMIGSEGRCRKYCDSDDDCGSGRCAFSIAAGIGTCSTTCNPLASTCSNFNDRCYVFSVSGGPAQVTDCQRQGSGPAGSTCSAVTNCSTDTCVSGACREVCPLNSTTACGSMTCTPVPGWTSYGICR